MSSTSSINRFASENPYAMLAEQSETEQLLGEYGLTMGETFLENCPQQEDIEAFLSMDKTPQMHQHDFFGALAMVLDKTKPLEKGNDPLLHPNPKLLQYWDPENNHGTIKRRILEGQGVKVEKAPQRLQERLPEKASGGETPSGDGGISLIIKGAGVVLLLFLAYQYAKPTYQWIRKTIALQSKQGLS